MSLYLLLGPIAQATPTPTQPVVSAPMLIDFGSPVWQGIGVVVTIAIGVVTILLWRADRKKRELTYEVVSDTPLVTLQEEEELKDRLVVLFDDHPAPSMKLRSIILRVRCTGNESIEEADFADPPEFRFGDASEVLAVTTIRTEPDYFRGEAVREGNKAVLKARLLNSGQSVTFKVLVKDPDGVQAYAHIRNAKLRPYQEYRRSRSMRLAVPIMLIFLAVTAASTVLLDIAPSRIAVPLGMVALLATWLTLYMVERDRYRER